MDAHQSYYRELGFDGKEFNRLNSGPHPHLADLYFQNFFPGAVERLLADYAGQECVFDLGAGHTVYDDKTLFARVQRALAPYPNVVLVLPSPDPDESIGVLREREKQRQINPRFLSDDYDHFGRWVKSPCNYDLAKIILYTEGKAPEESCDEVMRLLKR
jgi:hypothetical protein